MLFLTAEYKLAQTSSSWFFKSVIPDSSDVTVGCPMKKVNSDTLSESTDEN